MIKQKGDSYSFNDYPIETKVKMTDVISQSKTITCKIVDKDPKYFVSGGFQKNYQGMGYWLYVPPKANIREKLPLIVFLHGLGERGTNLDNAIIIIEECQNYEFSLLKKTLTRIGENTKTIVIGHTGQIDLNNPKHSGFEKYINHFSKHEKCAVCELHTNHRSWVSQWADECAE